MKAYKVLDVREKEETYTYTDNTTTYTTTHTVFVIIAEDVNGKRKRFHMYDGYKSLFLYDWHYYGHKGDFDLLVKGDWFEIEKLKDNFWPVVTVLGVSDGT
jgi:hypothetical protein